MLALLGSLSGTLGTSILGGNYGTAPRPGAYLVLAGVWFGLVIGFAVWRWAEISLPMAAMTVVITWLGWETAVNVGVQIDQLWPLEFASAYKSYVTGLVAGAIGAAITWLGVAIPVPVLRRSCAAAAVTATGAVLGLLLIPATNVFDSSAILLLPWQAAVAAMIGFHLPHTHCRDVPI